MVAQSLLSSSSSSACESLEVSQVLRVASPDSMGIKASAPNVSSYMVSPIGYFGVVQYAQSAMGSSLTHFPFADVNLFFK